MLSKKTKITLNHYLAMSCVCISAMCIATSCAYANSDNLNTEVNQKMFSLRLGATRVIYNINSPGASLSVQNVQDYPMLVQSEVFAEDKKSTAPFIVTPPLFRLDAQQSSRLRIVRTEAGEGDRETLQWLCVKGIPPKEDDKWAESHESKINNTLSLQVRISISNCVKLFVRPEVIKGNSEDMAGQVKWQVAGKQLKGTNQTPFYINLSELKIGGRDVQTPHYIQPYSSYTYDLPEGRSGTTVQWRVITDNGVNSKLFESNLSS